jgi:hypothetical protein
MFFEHGEATKYFSSVHYWSGLKVSMAFDLVTTKMVVFEATETKRWVIDYLKIYH